MRAALAGLLAALAVAPAASAAPRLVTVGKFEMPVHLASPPGDPDLYVVEKAGRVQLIDGGTTHLFLDTRATTEDVGEQGLLSIAFHPDHAANGLFYVFEALDDGPGDDDADALAVVGYRRDPQNALRALPESRTVVLRIPHEEAGNHDGGQLQFGPDGMLWVSVGDGGAQGDPAKPGFPEGDARSLASPLGKLLRFDPLNPPADPVDAVLHYGLRNPWRFSFDRETGDLVVGDVGGSVAEELTFVPAAEAGTPQHFGWNCYEGTHHHASRPNCSEPFAHRGPSLVLPRGASFTSVIAGYVVRDPQVPSLLGRFVYSDLSQSWVRAVTLPAADDDTAVSTLEVAGPLSFGEDACGRVYVMQGDGRVARIEENQPSGCLTPADPDPGPGAQPDTRPCAVGVDGRRQRLRRRLRLLVTSDEACTLTVRARVRRVARFRARTLTLAAGERRKVRLGLEPRARRKLRRALRRRGALRVRLAVAATDAAGNTSAAAGRVRLRPRR